MIRLVAVWFIVGSLAATAHAAPEPAFEIERAKVFIESGAIEDKDVTMDPCPANDAPGVVRVPIHAADEPVRVRLEVKGDAATDGWSIAVESSPPNGWKVSAGDAERERGETPIWSDTVRGSNKAVVLRRETRGAPCPSVRITGLFLPYKPSQPSSRIGQKDLWTMEHVLRDHLGPASLPTWANAVGRIRFISDADKRGYFCTGFLVTERVLLTNHHCLGTPGQAASAEVDFGYDTVDTPPAETVRVSMLLVADRERDYALCLLKRPVRRGVLMMAAAAPGAKPLVVLQHPEGLIKHVSINDCAAAQEDVSGLGPGKTDFSHRCDTEPGSSGSPVQDAASGWVVGLHHLGVMAGTTDPTNQAVNMAEVLKHIHDRLTEIEARRRGLSKELTPVLKAALERGAAAAPNTASAP
jgi:hypothetical protein